MNMRFFYMVFACLLVLPFSAAHAGASDNETPERLPLKELLSTTQHTTRIKKKTISYSATAGRLILVDDAGKQTAQLFFTAYTSNAGNASGRPVTFAFNGGPGSSSVWLHFGAMGPKRVRLGAAGAPPPPPAALIDNEHTWLAFTDMVFIDPVGTGYSRAVDTKEEKSFYGIKKDFESVGDFIRLYITRYNRWLSPKFVVGESYGTTRAVGVTDYLHTKHGIDFNGIVLVSPVLNYNTIRFDRSNDLAYVLFLPSYAAAAWYHKLVPSQQIQLAPFLKQVEDWALDTYIVSLAKGATLPEKDAQGVASEISSSTGLSESYVLKSDLAVPSPRFRKELLREKQVVIGRMDARFTGPDTDGTGEAGYYDPSLEMLIGPFSSAANHYVRNDLGFKSDTPYTYLNHTISRSWDWSAAIKGGQGYVDVSEALTDALHINNSLKVFIAAGYYDLATPYFAARYTADHLALKKELRDNISIGLYDAGHMMYIDQPSLKKFTADISSFYKKALGAE